MDYAGFAFRMCNPYLRIDLFGFRVPTSWQAGQTGTNLPFLLRVLSASCKNACWELPKPFSKLHPVDAGCAFLRNTSIPVQTKKARQRPTQNRPLACFVYRLCCRSGCGVSSAKNRSIFFCARKSRCISSLALRYSG